MIVSVLIGLVLFGYLVSWFNVSRPSAAPLDIAKAYLHYTKRKRKSHDDDSPWSKLDDNNEVTPFPPPYEKDAWATDGDDREYVAPVIGSRRALALARSNAFNPDSSLRPNSDVMVERGGNRAGMGAGNIAQYDAYPEQSQPYGVDSQGRPYHPQAGRTPMLHTYQEQYTDNPHAVSQSGNTRQLLGPASSVNGLPTMPPIAMGRPAPPTTLIELAQHEDFADSVEPHASGMMLPYDEGRDGAWTPRTATTMGEWAGDPRAQQSRSRVSMISPNEGNILTEDTSNLRSPNGSPPRTLIQMPLPVLQPMSPLLSGFDLQRRSSSQPLALYDDDSTQQRRMYAEVARAAGVAEPRTPHIPVHVTQGNFASPTETSSSFSAHEPASRLPSLTVATPQPYIHGRPLSPLMEHATPLSVASGHTLSSSSIMHGHNEINPFDRSLIPHRFVPPHPTSSGIPSPHYPPPSPGGMSVPGSVSNSPRRWSGGPGHPNGRGVSMFDGDDAYGGI